MNTLDEIANKYNTDKGSNNHHYASIYETYFSDFRHKAVNILEVGVQKGNSIRMWHEFFPKANIYGFDNWVELGDFSHIENELDRVKIYTINQEDKHGMVNLLNEIGVEFDIIIEDGSHMQHHQQQNLAWLLPYVKKGGYYVIEDIYFSYYRADEYRRFADETSTLDMIKTFISNGVVETNILQPDEIRSIESNVSKCSIEYGQEQWGPAEFAILTKK